MFDPPFFKVSSTVLGDSTLVVLLGLGFRVGSVSSPIGSKPCRRRLISHSKILLEELKSVQEATDKERKQLGDQSAEYSGSPALEHILGPDTTEHVLKAMGQAGITFNGGQQKELERLLADS